MKSRIRAIVTGSIGNWVEWYDFYAYTAFSLYFAPAFFPSQDPVVQQLNAAALFASGFLVRPLGGWLFGHLADKYGRKRSLTLSVMLMCAGSLLIALTPSYASIGLAAPFLLAIARMIEGLSLGGEYGTSATYLSEVAHPEHRGFASSFQYVTLIGGQLTAVFVLLVLQSFLLSEDALRAWGWRIPFALGAALAIVAARMRRDLHETLVTPPTRPRLREHPREVAIVIGMTAGGTAAFYTFTTYMQTFVHLSVGLSERTTTWVIAGSLIFAAILQPIYGALSDRIGRKPLLIVFGACGTVLTAPLLHALRETRSAWTALLLICSAWLFTACYTSINAVVKAELFPAAIRARGVGVPYALTVSLFGGTAPVIALWCKRVGHEAWFYAYLSAVIGASSLVYALMRDTLHTTRITTSEEEKEIAARALSRRA